MSFYPPGQNNMDGKDDRTRSLYDKKTGLVAKPTARDAEVAAYGNTAWVPCWYASYLDFQPAPGRHTLDQHGDYEWGAMAVVGEGWNPPILGLVVLGADADGEPTISIR